MALPSYYSVGTATVAANGVTVTGQGTNWLNAIQPGDLFGTHKGFGVRILSVNSNTSLTLAFPWPAAAQATAAYEIQITPDVSRMDKTTRDVLELLQNGNLDAIAVLVSAADKVPYYTGAGVAALADLRAKGRDLIGAADTAALLSKLGSVNGGTASQPVPSAADLGMADGDFNTVTAGGTFAITGNWANGPSGAAASGYAAILAVTKRFANTLQELRIYSSSIPVKWVRWTDTSGNWGAWMNETSLMYSYSANTEINNSNLPERLRNSHSVLADANLAVEDGFYRCSSGTLNIPEGAQGSLIVSSVVTGSVSQIFIRSSNNNMWTRTSIGGVIGTWRRSVNRDEILGTVSQSGGLPTGAIVERGSNANGEYVRFADGTQICTGRVIQSGPITTASGPVFGGDNQVWTFPIGFPAASPIVSLTRCGSAARWGTVVSNTGSSATVRVLSTVSSASDILVDTLAIGKWF